MKGNYNLEGAGILGFDPPATSNMGWAVLLVQNGVGVYADSGIKKLPAIEGDRYLAIEEFVVGLVEQYNIKVFCFERAIGFGDAVTREHIGESTGIIKLVGYQYGSDVISLHTSTMAKLFTGSGAAKKKKSRIKSAARDLFFPDRSFKSIACSDEGVECFEHQADALGFGTCYLLQQGIPVMGANMLLTPTPPTGEPTKTEGTSNE